MGYCTEIGLLSILFVPFAQCTCKNVKKFKVKGRPWKLLSSVVVNSHKLGLYTQVFHFFLSFCMSLLLLLWKKRKFIIHLLYRIKKVFWYITLSGTSFSSSYSSLFFLFLPFLFALNLNNIITEDGKKKIVRENKKKLTVKYVQIVCLWIEYNGLSYHLQKSIKQSTKKSKWNIWLSDLKREWTVLIYMLPGRFVCFCVCVYPFGTPVNNISCNIMK